MCWHDADKNRVMTAQVTGHGKRKNLYYAQCDDGSVLVLGVASKDKGGGGVLKLDQILDMGHWRDYYTAKKANTAETREIRTHVRAYYADDRDTYNQTLYTLEEGKAWSHIPFFDEYLYVPWLCQAPPTLEADGHPKKGVMAAWIKKGEKIEAFFNNDTSTITLPKANKEKEKVTIEHLKEQFPKLVLVRDKSNNDEMTVLCLKELARHDVVGYFGGELVEGWPVGANAKAHSVQITQTRHASFLRWRNVVSSITSSEDSVLLPNVKLVAQNVPGTALGLILTAVAIRAVPAGTPLRFGHNFGMKIIKQKRAAAAAAAVPAVVLPGVAAARAGGDNSDGDDMGGDDDDNDESENAGHGAIGQAPAAAAARAKAAKLLASTQKKSAPAAAAAAAAPRGPPPGRGSV